jgi:predicted transposase YbfD/YdcC
LRQAVVVTVAAGNHVRARIRWSIPTPHQQGDVWICPQCGARLISRNLWHSCGQFTLKALFAGAAPGDLELARAYVAMLHSLGDVQVIAQKTRLVCVARVRFAGLTDTVVTADALHTQREHADWLVTHKHAAWLLVVKHNQPALYQQLIALPWHQVPAADRTPRPRPWPRRDLPAPGHHRRWPGLPPRRPSPADHPASLAACRPPLAHRHGVCHHQPHRRPGQPRPPRRLDPRAYWGIEALHHIRDVTFAEDASQLRTGAAPRTMASLRNLAVAILRRHGHRNIAAALRYYARDAIRLLPLLGSTSPEPGAPAADHKRRLGGNVESYSSGC